MTASVRSAILHVFLSLVVAGCGALTEHVRHIDSLDGPGGEPPTILLMPPDIVYLEMTAGGELEPHASWTDAARSNFSSAAQAFTDERGAKLVIVNDDMSAAQIRYRKLHGAVAEAVMLHHLGEERLPSKGRTFDWSLGPGVREIAEERDADYALFASYSDKQATRGRMALGLLGTAAAAAATGGGLILLPRGTVERGFASLVDLKTGDIVWFNVVKEGTGEFRDPEGARKAVAALLKNMPPVEGTVQPRPGRFSRGRT